jgi:hypothetical protein
MYVHGSSDLLELLGEHSPDRLQQLNPKRSLFLRSFPYARWKSHP